MSQSTVPELITNGKLTNDLDANGHKINNLDESTATANPTGTVGLTVVNGSAGTLMRSDAAPPLSQAIAPTWTAQHIWRFDGLAGAQDDTKGVLIENTTVTTSGAKVQISPELRFRENLWTGGGTHTIDFRIYGGVTTSGSNPAPGILFDYSGSGGAYSTLLYLGNDGGLSVGFLPVNNVGAGVVNANTGFQVGQAATSGHFLRGNGTSYVDGAIQSGDLPTAPNYWDTSVEVSGSDAGTSSASLVDITGLSVALVINSVYEFEAVVLENSSADTNGTKVGVQYSAAGATVAANVTGGTTSGTAVVEWVSALNTSTSNLFSKVSGGTAVISIKGFLTTGANAGNLTIQHSKATSGTTTSKIGSILKVKKM